jgi:hypothetical protein
MPASSTKPQRVVKEFTDQAGKRWKVGDTYTGSPEQVQAAIAAGQVKEAPADPNAPAE